jgi:DNA polymerase-4
VQVFSVDESFLDVTDAARDYLGATVIAHIVKQRLREECGDWITASVGVGPNKLIAKAASECMKPDGLTVVRPEQVISFLDTRGLEDICGIGPRIARRLDAMGITTIPELRACPANRLVGEFKSYGLWLYNAARGRDDSEVSSSEEDPKSMGHSYTFPKNLTTPDEIRHGLLGLCDKVAWRLRRDGFAARCITVYARFSDFSGAGKQHRFKEPIDDGLKLFDIAWNHLSPALTRGVRLLGISASELTRGPEQPSLFRKEQKMAATLSALDQLQHRFGNTAWTRASLLSTRFLARTSGFHYDHEI